MVLPNFVDQAIAGEPITVFGNGKQSRCFCHVDDTVEAVMRLLDSSDTGGEVFNVGSTREITMYDLAQLVLQAVGSNSRIELIPYDKAYAEGFEDMERRIPDTTKIENATGFRPRITLEEIVADVIADRRSRHAAT
jgi:UDP-glucose 4-epimerase